jgi:hypothetical protein
VQNFISVHSSSEVNDTSSTTTAAPVFPLILSSIAFLGDHTGFEVLNKTMKVIAPPQQDLETTSAQRLIC